MARVKNHTKVKEPIRLRMKPLSDGSKSLYLDIYRDGKRTYEYLKMYIMEKPNKFDPFGQTKSAHLIYHTIAPLKVLVMGVNFILPF